MTTTDEPYETSDDAEASVADAQGHPEATPTAAAVDDGGDAADDAQEGAEGQKVGVRAKLKAAEADRDRLAATVKRAKVLMLDAAVARSGVSEQLRPALLAVMKADESADYLDADGLPDLEKLSAAVEAKREELGLPRKPLPNAVAGRGPGTVEDEVPTTFGGVLREHVSARGTQR
jgi:hypothetical protein